MTRDQRSETRTRRVILVREVRVVVPSAAPSAVAPVVPSLIRPLLQPLSAKHHPAMASRQEAGYRRRPALVPARSPQHPGHGAADATGPPPDRPRPAELFRLGALVSPGAAGTVIGLYALTLSGHPGPDPDRAVHRRQPRPGGAAADQARDAPRVGGHAHLRLAFALAAGFLLSVIPPLVTQGRNLIDDLPDYLASPGHSAQFRELDDRYNVSDQLQGLAGTADPAWERAARLHQPGLRGGVQQPHHPGLHRLLHGRHAEDPHRGGAVVPMDRRPHARRVVDLVVDKVGGYMIGNLIISLIAGVASYIAFLVLRVPFAVPLAFLIAVCDLIPMIGATLGRSLASRWPCSPPACGPPPSWSPPSSSPTSSWRTT